ncbi:MAG: GDP-mannose 4,6-dehydratase, partial [Candidatus Diapherotrites archaeon]|nr:GDP-mannose 4,6-dehydratase [Candidatus Diapherotrites archaeon]
FTVYGPRNRPDMAVYKFGDGIYHQRPISVFGDGNSKRDYTFVGDITRAIEHVLDSDIPFEIFNLGNHHPVRLKDLIHSIESELEQKAVIKNTAWPKSDPLTTFAGISKAKRLLGWKPKTPLKKGIRKFAQWYLKQRNPTESKK